MSPKGPWSPVEKGPRFLVVLLKFTGETRHFWEASLERLDDEIVILRAVANKELPFKEVAIHPGDLLLQYFPRSEWFYIQEYLTPSGRVKGWYCNIATPPQVQGSTITVRDLIVDIFVSRDGTYKVLDLEELEEQKGLLQADVIEKIHQAKEKLIQMIEKGEFPFHLQR